MTTAVEQAEPAASPDTISSFGGGLRAMTAQAPHDDTDRATRRRRVLMLTHRLPYPPDRGDRIRSYHLLKMLSKHFDIAIACTSDEPAWLQHHQLLSTMAKRVELQPITKKGAQVRGVAALLTGQAVTPASFYRQGLADSIRRWHEQAPFDAVLTFCTGMIHYARLVTQPGGRRRPPRNGDTHSGVRHVLDLVDVDSQKWASYADAAPIPAKWVYAAEAKRLRAIESGRFDQFDAITVVSQTEADCYRNTVGNHPGLTVVGNGVDMHYFSPQPDPNGHTIVFVGVLDYKPNYEGVTWFVQRVMPLLRQRVEDARFLIVGRNPTQKVKELGLEPGVEVVGSVPDVRTYIAESSAVIAPLRIARGVQNKVLEAMSCRRAVVCSRGAAQGVSATDGEHLLVADEPTEWAQKLADVLTDDALRRRLAAAARKRIEQCYTWDEQLRPMVKLLGGQDAD